MHNGLAVDQLPPTVRSGGQPTTAGNCAEPAGVRAMTAQPFPERRLLRQKRLPVGWQAPILPNAMGRNEPNSSSRWFHPL